MWLRVESLLLGECGYENPLVREFVYLTVRGCSLDRIFAGVGNPEGYSTSGI